MIKFVITLFIFIFLFFFSSVNLLAQEKVIIINELMPNPIGVDAQYEWIELFNNSNNQVDLTGWSIEGKSLTDSFIEPKDYLILVRNLDSYPDIVNKFKTDFNLVNTSDEIILKDPFGNIVDTFVYSESIEGKSNERRGILCDGYDQSPISSTISSQNSNYKKGCYELEDEVEEKEYKIEFSIDNLTWFDSVSSFSTELYFRLVDEKGIIVENLLWRNFQGDVINSPHLFTNYIDKNINTKIGDKNFQSENINIYPEIKINEFSLFSDFKYVEVINNNSFDINIENYNFEINGTLFPLISSEGIEFECKSILNANSICISIFESEFEKEKGSLRIKVGELSLGTITYQNLRGNDVYSFFDNQWNLTLPPSPGYSNTLETLQISEVYPNINVGESEWVELFNFGNILIDLSNFYFSDGKECYEVTSPFYLQGEILSNRYVVFYKDRNGVTLNDSGDTIRLCSKHKEEVNAFKYNKSVKGKSISKEYKNDKYLDEYNPDIEINFVPYITAPTINQQNIIFQESGLEKVLEIKNAKESLINSEVLIEGYVTVEKNRLFQDTFYIQDDTAGIRIYTKEFENFSIGQKVRVRGKLSEISNEKKINATLVEGFDEIKFYNFVQLTSLNKDLLGSKVYIEGNIINNYSSSFDIQTRLGLIRISVLSMTNIEIGEKSKGDLVKVNGIFLKEKEKYNILPIDQSDLEIIHFEETPTVKKSKTTLVNKIYNLGENEVLGNNTANNEIPKIYNLQKDNNTPNLDNKDLIIFVMFSVSLLGISIFLMRKELKIYFRRYFTDKENLLSLPKISK